MAARSPETSSASHVDLEICLHQERGGVGAQGHEPTVPQRELPAQVDEARLEPSTTFIMMSMKTCSTYPP